MRDLPFDAAGGSSRWWLRLATEPAAPATGCEEQACDWSELEPVDVYCRSHERLLPLGGERGGRRRAVMINAARVVACLAFVLSAQFRTAVPLLIVAVGGGCALVGLQLRRYPTAWRVAVASWVIAGAVALGLYLARAGVHPVLVTIVLFAVAAAYLALFLHMIMFLTHHLHAHADSGEGPLLTWSSLVGMSGSAAVVASLLYVAVSVVPPDWLWAPSPIGSALAVAALTCAVGTLLTATIGGAVEALASGALVSRPVRTVVRIPAPPVRRVAKAAPVRWSTIPTGMAERLARTVTTLVIRLASAALIAARRVASGALFAGYRVLGAVAATVNWTWRQIVTHSRRVRTTLVSTGHVLRYATPLSGQVSRWVIRVLAVPVGAVLTAAVAAVGFSVSELRYLLTGSLSALALVVAATLVTVLALELVVVALASLQPARSGKTLWRSATIAGPNTILVIAVAGWVVGLPGVFGLGPIRIGWVTIGSTLLVIVAWVVTRLGGSLEPDTAREVAETQRAVRTGREDTLAWAAAQQERLAAQQEMNAEEVRSGRPSGHGHSTPAG